MKVPGFIQSGRFNGHRDVGEHSHIGTELIYIAAGHCANVLSDGQTLDGPAGVLHVLPAGTKHVQRTYMPTETWYVVIDTSDTDFGDELENISLVEETWVPQWIDQLCLFTEKTLSQPSAVNDALSLAIVERLKQIRGTVHSGVSNLHPALRETAKWMRNNVDRECSVESLSKHAGISSSHLIKLFLDEHKMGPMRYLQELRLDYADRLLRDPYLTVKEVAFQCGYTDANYFSRIYKKRRGCTPKQAREH